MRSFTAWLKKEALEGARSYRFLVLGAAAAFFAFLDPVMLKLLPLIVRSQVGADLGALIPASRDYAFESSLGDLFEILSLVVCVALGGVVARERKDRTFVIPISKGARFGGIVTAKVVVWAAYTALAVSAAVFVSYLYAGALFPGSGIVLSVPARAALHMSLYFGFVVALVVLMSSTGKSGAVSSLLSVAVVYGAPALASLLRVEKYVPSYLALGTAKLATLAQGDFLPSMLCAAAVAVACLLGSRTILARAEL